MYGDMTAGIHQIQLETPTTPVISDMHIENYHRYLQELTNDHLEERVSRCLFQNFLVVHLRCVFGVRKAFEIPSRHGMVRFIAC